MKKIVKIIKDFLDKKKVRENIRNLKDFNILEDFYKKGVEQELVTEVQREILSEIKQGEVLPDWLEESFKDKKYPERHLLDFLLISRKFMDIYNNTPMKKEEHGICFDFWIGPQSAGWIEKIKDFDYLEEFVKEGMYKKRAIKDQEKLLDEITKDKVPDWFMVRMRENNFPKRHYLRAIEAAKRILPEKKVGSNNPEPINLKQGDKEMIAHPVDQIGRTVYYQIHPKE